MKNLTLLTMILFWAFLPTARSQSDLTYQLPPAEILELADAPMPPTILLNRTGEQIVLLYRNRFVGIDELMEQELRLAGLRIDPATNSASRSVKFTKIQLLKVGEKTPRTPDGLPENPKIGNVTWSPDQLKIAFTNTTKTGLELWLLDITTGKCKKLTEGILNGNIGRSFVWFANSSDLLVKFIPSDRKPLIDKSSAIPTGPRISESEGGLQAQNRTYQDLLQDKADEFNFTQLGRSELFRVNVNAEKESWKEVAIYSSINFSPDGKYVMINTIHEPYSYIVPMSRFPSKSMVYDQKGKFIKTIVEKPLLEDLPKGFMATEKGIRSLRWREDQPATLVWAEALDGGDPAVAVDFRDEVFQLPAPFLNKPLPVLKTINRFSGITWGNENVAVATDQWWNTRNTKAYLFNPTDKNATPEIIFDRNYQDNYKNPGDFITARNIYGENTLAINGKYLYLSGPGYSENGVRPFIDRYDLISKKSERLWEADGKSTLEQVVFAIDIKKGIIVTSVQSQTGFPNYYIRNIIKKVAPQQITFSENPYKSLENVHKEVITYKRADGVDLSGTLYLPAGYERTKKEKLPLLMWAYPQEFKDAASAGQVTTSPHQFTSINYGSPLFWLTQGYAILDNAAFPIIGEGKTEPNDTFVEQLVANAKAAIDAVDRLGYIDRNKVAVGGHSYGAFMTANLLSHSGLFAAGIARSGAYNRTLTPFGFQSEERNYWEAPQIYNTMSPFMNAEKMKTPLLLIHGEADNNSGTFPLQSERYFNALKGLGATVRLVILPGESHGYSARENILHMLWETNNWLDTYVKNKK